MCQISRIPFTADGRTQAGVPYDPFNPKAVRTLCTLHVHIVHKENCKYKHTCGAVKADEASHTPTVSQELKAGLEGLLGPQVCKAHPIPLKCQSNFQCCP